MAGAGERFRDDASWLGSFAAEVVLVRCPSCGARAEVRPDPGADAPKGTGDEWRPRRLTCATCAHVERWSRGGGATITYGGPVDPYFGQPLLLQVPCCGELLWAFNLDHVDLLDRLVGATVRERVDVVKGRPATLVEKLPRWIKAADNRAAVQRGLAKLRSIAEA